MGSLHRELGMRNSPDPKEESTRTLENITVLVKKEGKWKNGTK